MISNKVYKFTKMIEIKNLLDTLKFSLVDDKATFQRCRNFIYKNNKFSFLKENNKTYIILNGHKLDITAVYHKERLYKLLTKGV